jgi:outer membrane protein assembly factor BamB
LFTKTAFLTTPEISPDGSLLYLAGASRNLHCLQTDNGRESWTVPVESAILNRPTLFTSEEGEDVIYIIESMDGRVRQFNSGNGGENWQFNCEDATGIESCQNAVEAEFRYVFNIAKP